MGRKPQLCLHGILGKYKCKECTNERQREWAKRNPEKKLEEVDKWRRKNPEKCRATQQRFALRHPERMRIYRLIHNYPEQYPLDSKCAFCGRTEWLEHGHLDYEDNGYNYLTVCHKCNCWMSKVNEGK